MRSGRLPDGTETNSIDGYVNSWQKLATPIEVMTGLKCVSFDPNIQFSSEEKLITLPVWFIELINNYYKEVHDDYYRMMNEGS